MTRCSPALIGPALLGATLLAFGCAAPQPPTLDAPEFATRTFDADQEHAFAAAAATLLDHGYTIAMSDRRAGLIRGEQGRGNSLTLQVKPVTARTTEVRSEPMVDLQFWTMFEQQLMPGQPGEQKEP